MFNNKQKLVAMAVVSMCVAPSVFASSVVEEITRISESIAILTAQKQELELKSQIATKKAEIGKLGLHGQLNATEQDVIPVIRGIEGVDGQLSATLSLGDGMQQTVKKGEKIRGDWTVFQIDVNAVTLARGSKKIRLAFGHEPASRIPSRATGQPTGSPFTQFPPIR